MQLKILFILLLFILISIAPSEWLSNTTSAIGAVRDYTVAGSEVAKVTVKTYNAMKDNGEVSFSEAYGYQSKIDGVQKESRDEGINFLTDSDKYNYKLVEEGILDINLNTVIYSDVNLEKGYSHKEQSEIGLNLKDNNTLVSSGDLENTYWHEVTHQNDRSNTTTRDREAYATNMGNSAEVLGSINNWLYGDGGLNNTTISNYYNKNQTTLQLNNEYVSNLNPFDLEYLKVHSRPLSFVEKLYKTPISFEHAYLETTITKTDFKKLKYLYNMKDVPIISETKDTVTLLISGFPSSDSFSNNSGLVEDSKLNIKFSAKEDLYYHNDPKLHHLVGENNNYQADYNALSMALAFANNYDNGNRLDYALTPYLFGENSFTVSSTPNKYNSNSLAVSIAKNSTVGIGGIDIDFTGFNPGQYKIIPINYFFETAPFDYLDKVPRDYLKEFSKWQK